MKWLLVGAAVCAVGIGSASAQPPPPPTYAPIPPPRAEVVPPPPGGPMVWEPGHWHWDGYRYVWRPGHYVQSRPDTATTPKVAGSGRHAKDGGSGVRRIGSRGGAGFRLWGSADTRSASEAGQFPATAHFQADRKRAARSFPVFEQYYGADVTAPPSHGIAD